MSPNYVICSNSSAGSLFLRLLSQQTTAHNQCIISCLLIAMSHFFPFYHSSIECIKMHVKNVNLLYRAIFLLMSFLLSNQFIQFLSLQCILAMKFLPHRYRIWSTYCTSTVVCPQTCQHFQKLLYILAHGESFYLVVMDIQFFFKE